MMVKSNAESQFRVMTQGVCAPMLENDFKKFKNLVRWTYKNLLR